MKTIGFRNCFVNNTNVVDIYLLFKVGYLQVALNPLHKAVVVEKAHDQHSQHYDYHVFVACEDVPEYIKFFAHSLV